MVSSSVSDTYLFEIKIKTKTFRFTAAATRRHTEKAGGSHSWAVRRIRVLNEPRFWAQAFVLRCM